jgi:signal transduction histidine kinase
MGIRNSDLYWPKSQCLAWHRYRRLVVMKEEIERATRLTVAGELVAAVTHDLRQPLTAIEMNVSAAMQFLRRTDPQPDRALEALEDALLQQRRMRDALKLLEDLTARREPLHDRCDLAHIAREAIALIEGDAAARQVPIELDVGSPIPPVSGDATLIRSALLNLLLGAVEATSVSGRRDGPVQLTLGAGTTGPTATVTHFGLRPDARSPDGGLALARSVTDAHGGSIAIEGSADTGIRVLTTWPPYAE